jgi:hypothetical protein
MLNLHGSPEANQSGKIKAEIVNSGNVRELRSPTERLYTIVAGPGLEGIVVLELACREPNIGPTVGGVRLDKRRRVAPAKPGRK